MKSKNIGAAVAIGIACLTLSGCVSDTGTYSNYRYVDRSDGPNFWYRGRPDRHHRPDRPNGHDHGPGRPGWQHGGGRPGHDNAGSQWNGSGRPGHDRPDRPDRGGRPDRGDRGNAGRPDRLVPGE